MTNTTPAAYPLMLLYRLMKYSPSHDGIFLGHGKLDDPADPFLAERVAVARQFADSNVDTFRIESKRRGTEHSLVFSPPVLPITLAMLAYELEMDAQLNGGPSRPTSDYELLAAVMALGEQEGSYGSSYWSREAEVLHVLACGISWKDYGGVSDTTWSEWTGTFTEPDNVKKFGAWLRCRNWPNHRRGSVEFGIEPPSIAQLFSALGAGSLEKIFNV